MKRTNIYKKLIIRAKGKIRSARIPRTLSKKNNNVFSNEKHIIMHTLMQKEKKHYRDMSDFLDLLKEEIGLPRIPHYTTTNKFTLRAKPLWFEQLIAEIIKQFETEEALNAVIDGTGFSLNSRSKYFETIAGKRKQFMQFNACGETKHKLITAIKIRRKRRNENIDVNCLMRKSTEQLKISNFLADKEYDSEKNHELAEKYGDKFIAPLKNKGNVPIMRTKGIHRKQLKRNFPREMYNLRVLIESIFSSMKRKYGDIIYARKFVTQKNELLCRAWTYDLVKSVNLFKIEIYFLQSLGEN